ncbi:MAG TPA: 50S ribosomal protein L29 [Candidatus Paceibacterota bacterium]
MKKTQTLQNIRTMDSAALTNMIKEERARLLELRIQHRIAPIKNIRQIRQSRRAIAQMETVLQDTKRLR